MGTNFHHEGGMFTPEESGMTADGPEMAFPRDLYAAASPDGPDHWPVVFAKITKLWGEEPTLTVEDVARIASPTLVMVGDDDIIRLDHTVALFEALPHGQLAVVPGASHGLPMEKPAEVSRLILEFLRQEGDPRTSMPIRRATRTP
jgi:pimeloyl-ACP methyl ester carboxylesterase